jgi:hypothetical protein
MSVSDLLALRFSCRINSAVTLDSSEFEQLLSGDLLEA